MTTSTVKRQKLVHWIIAGLFALALAAGPVMVNSAEAGCSNTASTICTG